MAIQNRTTLKGYFNSGDRPNEAQFEDLIDSSLNSTDDKATQAEAEAGALDTKFMTPLKVKQSIIAQVPSASETVKGLIEIATTTEVQTGNDTFRAVTPAGAKASVIKWAPVKTVNGITPNSTTGDVALGLDDTGWLTLNVFNTTNGISAYDNTTNSVRYRRKNGVVYLDGKVKGGTAQNGSNAGYILFTLPAGFRPDRRMNFAVYKADTLSSFSIGRIDIEYSGAVAGVSYSPVYTNLTGICFPVG